MTSVSTSGFRADDELKLTIVGHEEEDVEIETEMTENSRKSIKKGEKKVVE